VEQIKRETRDAYAVSAHFVLKIDNYPSPVITEEWRDSVIDNRRKDATEEDVAKTILWGAVDFAKIRVAQGHLANNKKLRWLVWARRLITIASVLNFLVISTIVVSRFF
jgi:hypothetical protein